MSTGCSRSRRAFPSRCSTAAWSWGRRPPTRFDAALDWLDARGVPHRIWIVDSLVPDLGQVLLTHGFTSRTGRIRGWRSIPSPRFLRRLQASPWRSSHSWTSSGSSGSRSRAGCRPPRPMHCSRRPSPPIPTSSSSSGRSTVSPWGRQSRSGGATSAACTPSGRSRLPDDVVSAAPSTWAAVAAGQAWGCDTIVLQASEMGFPIYAAMGFRTVVEYTVFGGPVQRRD